MKIFKQQDSSVVFPYIAYIPDEISEKPALIIQLHGAGERGYGKENLDKVFSLCTTLRNNGFNVDMSFENKSMGASFKIATRKNAKFCGDCQSVCKSKRPYVYGR